MICVHLSRLTLSSRRLVQELPGQVCAILHRLSRWLTLWLRLPLCSRHHNALAAGQAICGALLLPSRVLRQINRRRCCHPLGTALWLPYRSLSPC